MKFDFAIDRGGTFTDIFCVIRQYANGDKNEEIKQSKEVMKLLSVDPTNYSDAPTEGIRRILNKYLA
jgi:5-oxoprolinase (ATP-hydrolysing)